MFLLVLNKHFRRSNKVTDELIVSLPPIDVE